jgi:N-acetylglutamate synthase-like GNAT family acetyltransferase
MTTPPTIHPGCASARSTPRSGASVLNIRPLDAGDRTHVAALFGRLSRESLLQRFHSAGVCVADVVLDQVTAGHVLIAELDGRLVGVASYHPFPDAARAELAIVVDDTQQRRGIGTALCAALSSDARRAGIRHLRADLLRTNAAMLQLLRCLELPMRLNATLEVLEVTLDLEPLQT